MTLAVGFFDGVHLGHQAILKGADRALTFLDHPLSVLAPEKAPRLLMSVEERLRALARPVTLLTFTSEFAEMSAADFAARFLAGAVIRCGANWRFGKGGEGSPEWLRAHGYEVQIVPYAEYRGEVISSSRIRTAIARGEIEVARAMLGHDLVLRGSPVSGKGEGRNLGYPTLNLPSASDLRPGVYSAIANYGTAPTFGDRAWQEPMLEVHLLEFLREERRFGSVEELKSQIAADIAAAKAQSGTRK